ncbi:hypothetical protein [Luteolibacter sp. LG18]|uniref:hypothetical protein n=1 Tax=Luteolibacter sp. LG18 TaxID=2819286 RepID=UPI002B2D924B|nr:hypothetical protein llg_20360 [Luteolibacter sp. LG18]
MKSSILLSALLVTAATAAEPTVKLAGLQLVWDEGGQFGMFKTLNSEKGATAVLIISSDKQMVGVNTDKMAVKFGGATAQSRFFNADNSFTKDHKSLRLELKATGAWQAAADGTVKITGEIPVVYATGKDETKSEVLVPKEGAAIAFPADKAAQLPTLKVKSAEVQSAGSGSSGAFFGGDKHAYELTLTTNRKLDEFAGIRFLTKDGQPIEARQTMSSWMGGFGSGSGSITWSFKVVPTELVVVVESWTGREEGKIKVDVSAGAGGQK